MIPHMKRTTLLLDEDQLREGLRLGREKNVSDLVRRALADYVRRLKANQIWQYLGSGIWEGNLSEMRGDSPRGGPPPKPPRRARRSGPRAR
jgi:hypothetical protein